MKTLAQDLNLGDVIQIDNGAYHHVTVKRINSDGSFVGFRPYVHTANFECGGEQHSSVICYIGIEEYTLFPKNEEMFEVVQKGDKLL